VAEQGGDHSLAAEIVRHGVTHLQCTPSLMRMARADDAGRRAVDRVSHLFVGGEAFGAALADELAAHSGSVTNMYGPTETTVWSSTQRVTGGSPVPLGRPIANTRLYVLDAQRRPLPIGVPGELYIAGAGVARGYLNRPELSAERFLPDPFGAAGERMYQSGDRVRWSVDGVLEFLGRIDQQVKVRGHRIELGEIEAVLARQPGVRELVVVARHDGSHGEPDARLVAYLTGDADETSLREAARAQLPEFMVPSLFVRLPELPYTPNGKIDRNALPAPRALAPAASAYAAPQSELETQLATIWAEVLGLTRVGLDDNFFDSGGHSLLVVKLHRRLAGELGDAVRLTDLYRYPSVRALAAHLSAAQGDDVSARAQDRAALRSERLSARRELLQRRRPR
jgi:non-ribosomal peptide synthetase component F